MNPGMPFGEMLRVYRAHHGLSIRELAPQMGVSTATLSRVERGGMPDAPTMLRLLAWMFGEPAKGDPK